MKLILMGRPGAGKGTQAKILSGILGLPHISTGQLLRDAIKAGTELGRLAEDKVARGEFFADDFTIAFVKEGLDREDCKAGFILDGFPRTLPQAQGFFDYDRVILIEVTRELALERVSGRLMGEDGELYHETLRPPPRALTVTKRKDDDRAVAENRMAIFEAQTTPIFDYYESLDKLRRVNGEQSLEDVTKALLEALG